MDRKNIDLQTFLDNLDFNNLNNMASELLEYEDDDDANETSGVGSKRPASIPVAVIDKRESLFKRDLNGKQLSAPSSSTPPKSLILNNSEI